jgi:ribosomal protein L11 methyltransferase
MLEEIKQKIRDQVFRGVAKAPVGDLKKRIAKDAGVTKGAVKAAFRELVGEGELQYTYVHGTSFLEPSFDRPVHVSKRIVLKPPDKAYETQSHEVVVALAGGAAFGNGTHPTTRLALQALDSALHNRACSFPSHDVLAEGLDVGTGTGVLAIAMAKLGVQKVLATDIDPCAISEAKDNVLRNQLSHRIQVLDIPLERLGKTYGIIMANLAYPTLKRMAVILPTRTEDSGLLILSGFKVSASEDLKNAYGRQGLVAVGESLDRDWVCQVFCKTPKPLPSRGKGQF